MKKTLIYALSAVLLAGSVASCKKGENDPFLSLSSRKARLAGEYDITAMKSESTSTSGTTSTTSTYEIDGTTIKSTWSQGGTSFSSTGTVNKATQTILKDGTWEQEVEFTFVDGTSSETTNIKTSGTWNFLGGVDEYKKGERVVFNKLSETEIDTETDGSSSLSTTTTNTYGDGQSSEIYVISQLKSKEIILGTDFESTSTSGNSTSTNKSTVSMTLVQK